MKQLNEIAQRPVNDSKEQITIDQQRQHETHTANDT